MEGIALVVVVMALFITSLQVQDLLYGLSALGNVWICKCEVESTSVFKYLVTADGQVLLACTPCIPGAGGLLHPSVLLFPLL